MKFNSFEKTTNDSEKTLEKLQSGVGKKWLQLEEEFQNTEQKIEEEADKGKSSKAKVILRNTARAVLSVGKKLSIGTGIGAGLFTAYTAVDLERQTSFNEREKVQKELIENGIPSDQRFSAYKPGVSELIYRSVTPFGYQEEIDQNGLAPNLFKKLREHGLPNAGMPQDVLANMWLGRAERLESLNSIYEQEMKETSEALQNMEKELGNHRIGPDGNLTLAARERQNEIYERMDQKYKELAHEKAFSTKTRGPHQIMGQREDAWRLYLGLRQEQGTFEISNHKPAVGHDDKYYFAIKGFWEEFARWTRSLDQEYVEQLKSNLGEEELKSLLEEEGMKREIMVLSHLKNKKMILIDRDTHIMGNYTMGLGSDEHGEYIYYYDKWDLASKFAGNPITKGVGKAYEIYDRLYYDPVTFEIIDENKIAEAKSKQGIFEDMHAENIKSGSLDGKTASYFEYAQPDKAAEIKQKIMEEMDKNEGKDNQH
jgi:hypothetical protein